jgi:hypothetical protein
VLAIALCRDTVVQRAFPDGIAWITIGREWDGDFVTRMREVASALEDNLSGYDNPLACENRYRTILSETAALVVVDDVWNLEHLKPLLLVDGLNPTLMLRLVANSFPASAPALLTL